MIKLSISFICGLFMFVQIKADDNIPKQYQATFNIIHDMLEDSIPINFKNAVLETENVFCQGKLNIQEINSEIRSLAEIIEAYSMNKIIEYNDKDKNIINKFSALYTVMTDTIPIVIDSAHILVHNAFIYDSDDPFGQKDWSSMFVSKLLETSKGNCHSLPYLYKILAEEMGIPAYLAFAPNHIYIKSFSVKTGWYNTELTSGTFPIDAWIMASGYVTVDAIQNGLYMDTLSTKQSVANCLVDLAQGYQRRLGKDNPDFVMECCNTCLKYHPTNVNAMLTKAEAQKFYIQAQLKAKNLKNPQDLFANNTIKEMYSDMEQTYVKLHQLGYRRMPEEMYMQWMGILRNQPAKFINTKISTTKKKN